MRRKTTFLGIFVLSLTLILVCPMMVQGTFPSVFEVGSPEKIIFLEQERQNQGFGDRTGQNLAFTSIVLKSGLIRNTIWANAKTSCWATWLSPAGPKSITAQILLQSLARASPS